MDYGDHNYVYARQNLLTKRSETLRNKPRGGRALVGFAAK